MGTVMFCVGLESEDDFEEPRMSSPTVEVTKRRASD